MRRNKLIAAIGVPALVFLSYLAIGFETACAQSTSVPLTPGTIGAQVVGRVLILPDFSVKLYGYFTYMQGVPGPLFTGAPSENTAMLTFAADPTFATLVSNGDIMQGLENPANSQFTNLTVYYNAGATARNILNPDDFAQGQAVAQFHSRAAAVSISASGTFQATGALNPQTGSYFFINNMPVNIYNVVSGLTINLFGPALAIPTIAAGILANGNFSIPFSGTGYIAGTQN